MRATPYPSQLSDQPHGSSQPTSLLYSEFCFALSRVESHTLKNWGLRSAKRLPTLLVRRIGGIARLAKLVAEGGSKELGYLISAYQHGGVSEHLTTRSADAIDGTIFLARQGIQTVLNITRAFARDPRSTAIIIMGGLVGFEAGSGGLDGNGGIPDLDLAVGIGTHRSPYTHSIVAGLIIEGSVLAIADLAAEIYDLLPVSHDPRWDEIAKIGSPVARSLAIGTSAGLAYHLLVDGLVQPGTYHDLPVHLPIEAHEAIFTTNGITEGNDAIARAKGEYSALIDRPAPPTKTTGRKIVDAALSTSKSASKRLLNALSGHA